MASKKTVRKITPVLAADIEIGSTGLLPKVLFAKHLSIMLKAGLTITEALHILEQSSSGRLKRITGEVYASVKAGQKLSTALARYPKIFSQFFVGAVYAGESSGTLSKNLANVANELKKEKELSDKIKSALLYPVIILLSSLAMSLFLAFYILPKIVPLFEGLKMKLPWTTRALIAFSHLVENYGTLLLFILLALTVLLVWSARQRFAQPLTHWLLIKIPILKEIVGSHNLAKFSRGLGMLLSSGLTITEALEITAATSGNYYWRRALQAVGKSVTKGSKLSAALSKFSQLFPVMTVRMVAVGEESGRLEETLLYLADFYEGEVDNATKNLSTVIEPLLLIVIGLVVGFLALSIITPIYGITGGVVK